MISIIIPNFNGKELLEKNLPSVIDAVSFYGENCEIIVVDDGSNDGSCEFLKEEFKETKVISLKRNKGFSYACNQGAKISKGDILIFLNNDVKANENFISPLVECLSQNDDVFAVSPKIITPKRGVNSGLIYAEFKRGFIREKHQDLSNIDINDTKSKPTLYTSGAVFACKKDIFLELNGFDEVYNPYFFEDFDICYRAWKRGWKIIHEPNSVVFHDEQQTIGKNKKKAKMIYDRNRLIFHWENITDKDLRRQHFFYLGIKLLLSIIFCRWHYLKSFKDALKYIKQIKQDNIRQITRFTDKEILKMFL